MNNIKNLGIIRPGAVIHVSGPTVTREFVNEVKRVVEVNCGHKNFTVIGTYDDMAVALLNEEGMRRHGWVRGDPILNRGSR